MSIGFMGHLKQTQAVALLLLVLSASICPTDSLADLLSGLGWPVWRYEFDIGEVDGPTTLGALESR